MAKQTLCELFESNKAELQQALTEMVLPKDLNRVQETVSSYLGKVFDSEGEFRQNLTQSEDYILEAAISLLNAQQKISVALTKEVGNSSAPKLMRPTATTQEETPSPRGLKTDTNYMFAGVAGGAIAGKLLLGGWGAVFGAIAGVAVSVYLSNRTQVQAKPNSQAAPKTLIEDNPNKPIDVECFLSIIYNVCESVDNLIGTFRAQVNRVVQKYESQEKPSLDKEYRILLENIQSLVGYERNHDATEEKYIKKVQERIEDLAELLDNYDITLENYSDEKASWFDKVASPNATELKEVFPAVVKKGTLIIPGRVFIPA